MTWPFQLMFDLGQFGDLGFKTADEHLTVVVYTEGGPQ